MLVFELLVYPFVAKRIGPTKSQRWACCIATPVSLSYPFLSMLHDNRRVLLATSLVLLFFNNVSMTVVSAMLALLLPLSPLLSCEHVAGTGDIAARTASVVVRFLSPPVRSAWTFSRVKIYLTVPLACRA